jgi:hypothetical protein
LDYYAACTTTLLFRIPQSHRIVLLSRETSETSSNTALCSRTTTRIIPVITVTAYLNLNRNQPAGDSCIVSSVNRVQIFANEFDATYLYVPGVDKARITGRELYRLYMLCTSVRKF